MWKIPIPRYRVVLILGAGYVVVFIGVAVLRLWWDDGGAMNLQSAAFLVPSVVLLWGVGSLSFLPLIWTLRRFRRSRWIPIVAYAIALPFSLLGALFGGLLGPLGVLVYAVAPLALAVGISFGIQAILGLRRPRTGTIFNKPKPNWRAKIKYVLPIVTAICFIVVCGTLMIDDREGKIDSRRNSYYISPKMEESLEKEKYFERRTKSSSGYRYSDYRNEIEMYVISPCIEYVLDKGGLRGVTTRRELLRQIGDDAVENLVSSTTDMIEAVNATDLRSRKTVYDVICGQCKKLMKVKMENSGLW